MNKDDDIDQGSIQLQIPSTTEAIHVPTLIVADVNHNTTIAVEFDDVFDQVAQLSERSRGITSILLLPVITI